MGRCVDWGMIRYISFILFIGLTFGSRFLPAQTISNVQARQEGLEIIITYDMAGKLQSGDEIMVGYPTDGGRNYKSISNADGDVGKNVKPGTGREISFFANDALAGNNANFKVFVFSVPSGMVYVAGGTFQMGSNSESDEKPIHTVTISGFFMNKTEVTQAEYRKVMGKTPSHFRGCDDCPVENVSWHDANAYAKKVGKRLPTEAEWEYAARGGNKSKGYIYSGSNDLNTVGWYKKNSGSKTHPVAQKQPNELGLYDMSGNVWEWCSDWYNDSYYRSSPKNDPQGSNLGSSRVLRGGIWPSSYAIGRVADRGRSLPNYRSNSFGFRLVLSQDL